MWKVTYRMYSVIFPQGYWQTAEISPTGFSRRPWHCENRSGEIKNLVDQYFLTQLASFAYNVNKQLC